jgi:hypothetical protein
VNGESADHADSDFDGCGNLAEYACGTDPLISFQSKIALLMSNAGVPAFSLSTAHVLGTLISHDAGHSCIRCLRGSGGSSADGLQ